MECPVGAFAGAVGAPRDLDEAVVEAEIVSQGVLPPLRVLAVVGEVVHDELVDVGERQHLFGRVPQRHGRQGDVRVGRLLVAVRISGGAWHLGGRRGRHAKTQSVKKRVRTISRSVLSVSCLAFDCWKKWFQRISLGLAQICVTATAETTVEDREKPSTGGWPVCDGGEINQGCHLKTRLWREN